MRASADYPARTSTPRIDNPMRLKCTSHPTILVIPPRNSPDEPSHFYSLPVRPVRPTLPWPHRHVPSTHSPSDQPSHFDTPRTRRVRTAHYQSDEPCPVHPYPTTLRLPSRTRRVSSTLTITPPTSQAISRSFRPIPTNLPTTVPVRPDQSGRTHPEPTRPTTTALIVPTQPEEGSSATQHLQA